MSVARRALAALALAAVVASCAQRPAEPVTPQATAELPRAFYDEALRAGKAVYRVDPAQSLVVIEVRRGGTLARLGHDHVVSARNLEGFVAPDAGRADLRVALDGLGVDEPELRQAAGLDTQPSESDIAGTRANMLERVLETQKFPYSLIRVERDGDALGVTLTLHGVTRAVRTPATVRVDGGLVEVSGRLEFNQSDFGITPFSVFGGAVAVQDHLALSFNVRALREAAH